jgi:hypothetical protein
MHPRFLYKFIRGPVAENTNIKGAAPERERNHTQWIELDTCYRKYPYFF